MSYLYLFYSDYIAENGNPYDLIRATKEKIKMQSLKNFKTAYISSNEIEQVFEKKYNLQPNDFGSIDIVNNNFIAESNAMMMSFDSAISNLKTLIKEGGTVKQAQLLGKEAIYSIDKILLQGASTGGLAEGAYNQVQRGLEKLKEAVSLTRRKGTGGKQWKNKDEILNMLEDIESNVSGYALEIALTYGFVGAYEHVMQKNHETMINIGSTTLSENVIKNFKEDPLMLQDLQKINNALISNKGTQSKADSVINMHMADGQGSVSADVSWVGFQEKNYRDISSIPTGVSKTLQDLGILSYYDTDLLVNTAGSLGNNYIGTKIPKTMARYPEFGDTQGNIDKVWNEIKNSMKLLLAADAITGEISQNFTNKVSYYVVRQKSSAKIRVIGVSKILDKIATAFSDINETHMLGINWGMSDSTRYSNRSEYWRKNVANFTMKQSLMAGQLRSNKAYPEVLNAILSTKISISLNFNYFFQ